MQLQRVRELPVFIVAIEQTRQRLEERQVVLVLPDGSGNSRYLCEYRSYNKHKQIVKLPQTIATACKSLADGHRTSRHPCSTEAVLPELTFGLC